MIRSSFVALAVLAACSSPAPPPPAATPTPATPTPEARAGAAMDELQKTLGGKLMAAMNEGGPSRAIAVCAEEAPRLAAQVSEAHGIALGRTSHKLRNQANAPRPWVQAYLDEHAARPAAEAKVRTVSLPDGKTGVIRPISTAALCTQCHGTAVADEVTRELAAKYPDDRATGFAEGDLRGVFWAEVPAAK